VFLVWFQLRMKDGEPTAVKWGQTPALSIAIPKEAEKALGDYADLWKKGMRSRHQGYGIGALAYFRRVVEGATGKLLGLLAESMLLLLATLNQHIEQQKAYGDAAKNVAQFRDKQQRKSP